MVLCYGLGQSDTSLRGSSVRPGRAGVECQQAVTGCIRPGRQKELADIDVDGVYERRLRPLCPPHLITLRLPVPCNCALTHTQHLDYARIYQALL